MNTRQAYDSHYLRWASDLSPKGRERYLYDVLRWERLTGNPDVADITTDTFAEFRRASIVAGHAPSTTEQSVGTVRQVLTVLVKLRLLPFLPDGGRPRKRKSREIEPPTPAEIEALYLATGCAKWPRLAAVPPHQFWRSWLATVLWTGLRMSDLTWGLRWSHISDGAIRYQASKTSKLHSFPVCPVLDALLQWMRCQPGERVFGCAKTPDKLRREIRRLCEQAQLDRELTSHDFRRASITHWSCADGTAAMIVHGVGLPRVLGRYQERICILRAAAERFPWPDAMRTHAAESPAAARLISAELAAQRREAMSRARAVVPVFAPPDPTDWQFKHGWFAYRGNWFPMPSPARLAVLRELVHSADPVPLSRIVDVLRQSGRRSVLPANDRGRIIISQVRGQLRKFLGLQPDDDPVPCHTRGDGGAWTLTIPEDVSEPQAVA